LLAIRRFLEANEKLFRATAAKAKKLMGPVQGSTLQRVPKGFDSEHPAADLIKRKQWYCWVELDPALATSPKLKAEIVKRFKAMAPMVELLNKPLMGKARAK
jgi:uncharacterized protein (DUF2461 family)